MDSARQGTMKPKAVIANCPATIAAKIVENRNIPSIYSVSKNHPEL